MPKVKPVRNALMCKAIHAQNRIQEARRKDAIPMGFPVVQPHAGAVQFDVAFPLPAFMNQRLYPAAMGILLDFGGPHRRAFAHRVIAGWGPAIRRGNQLPLVAPALRPDARVFGLQEQGQVDMEIDQMAGRDVDGDVIMEPIG